jgi:CheY-like chemotaxis protein
VLIIDDNRDSAEAMALLLESEGHQVVTINDGPGAIAKAREFNPDVAIVDIGLPAMDGYEVARQIHQVLPKVLLIAVSGWRIDPADERTRTAGFSLYFTKPMEPAKIKEILAHPDIIRIDKD